MKYIIEIENEPFGRNDDPVIPHGMDELYRAKGFKSLVFDQNGLDKLTPYTEPSQKAIDLQHAHDIENVASMNYSKGTEDAWEFVRIITDMTEKQRIECFGGASCNLDKYWTYQDAKTKYEAWEKQKDEVRVGDEVIFKPNDANGVVIKCHVPDVYADIDKYAIFTGSCVEYCPIEWITKTGRSFPEVAELLQKMRGEEQ